MPKLMIKSEIMSNFLYPTFVTTQPDGPPNIRKAEKVAATIRYDIPLLMSKALSRTGTMIPLMPTPNPMTKKAIPVMIKGNKNLFLLICDMAFLMIID